MRYNFLLVFNENKKKKKKFIIIIRNKKFRNLFENFKNILSIISVFLQAVS